MSFKSLYVGNLPYSTTEEQILEHFGAFGSRNARIVEGRGFGFVDVAADQMDAAIEATNGVELGGRKLTVNEARPKASGPRDFGGGGGGRPGGGGGGYGGGGGGGDRGGYGGGGDRGGDRGGYGGGGDRGGDRGGFGGGGGRGGGGGFGGGGGRGGSGGGGNGGGKPRRGGRF
ncbi:MAG: RNA recognition motif domain-containing protein [Fimbriimonas sp.]